MANLEVGSTVDGHTILTTGNFPRIYPVLQSGKSGYTGANNSSKFVKVATAKITVQYDQTHCLFDVMAGSNSTGYQTGTVLFRVKQQDTLGSSPVVTLTLSNHAGMSENDVVAVLSKMDTTVTVVDLYVRVKFTYDTLHYETRVLRYPKLMTIYDTNTNGGFLASVPTGIAQFPCSLVDGAFKSLKVGTKDVLNTDHISASDPHIQYVRKAPYTTLNQNATPNQYALIGTATITSQYQQAVSLVSLVGGANANINSQRGILYFRVKQQNAMGSAPSVELSLSSRNNFAPTDAVAIVTTNTVSQTVVQLYVKINNTYDQLWFNPIQEIGSTYSPSINIVWSNQAPLIAAKASLPAGTQLTAKVPDGLDVLGTINASSTSVTLIHNLGYVPTYIYPSSYGNTGHVWPTNITSTQITLNCATAPISDTAVSCLLR